MYIVPAPPQADVVYWFYGNSILIELLYYPASVNNIHIIEKTSVYHTDNGNRASKTAKMIKVILLRAPCQNVNVLLCCFSIISSNFIDSESSMTISNQFRMSRLDT